MKRAAIPALLFAICCLGQQAGAAESTKLNFDTYGGYFVSNTFEPKAAESFLVITDQKAFDNVFGVGFVMGDTSHRLPKDAFKSNMVVTAIKRGKAMWEFKVEGVTEAKGVVKLKYAASSKASDSASFACPLIVSIPKGKYTAVQFVENGKPVKYLELAPASGQRSKVEFQFEELLSKTLVVPKGVVYKTAGPGVNRQALEKLSQGFMAEDRKVASDDLFSSTLICGPGLWRNIKDNAEMKKITTGITKIKVPTSKGTQELEGKLFQGKAEVATFWKTFLLKYTFDGQSTIRRPTGQELQLYWAMIPYDITEPIFMIESKDATILAQFADKDVKIGWIDDYKDLRLNDKP